MNIRHNYMKVGYLIENIKNILLVNTVITTVHKNNQFSAFKVIAV